MPAASARQLDRTAAASARSPATSWPTTKDSVGLANTAAVAWSALVGLDRDIAEDTELVLGLGQRTNERPAASRQQRIDELDAEPGLAHASAQVSDLLIGRGVRCGRGVERGDVTTDAQHRPTDDAPCRPAGRSGGPRRRLQRRGRTGDAAIAGARRSAGCTWTSRAWSGSSRGRRRGVRAAACPRRGRPDRGARGRPAHGCR